MFSKFRSCLFSVLQGKFQNFLFIIIKDYGIFLSHNLFVLWKAILVRRPNFWIMMIVSFRQASLLDCCIMSNYFVSWRADLRHLSFLLSPRFVPCLYYPSWLCKLFWVIVPQKQPSFVVISAQMILTGWWIIPAKSGWHQFKSWILNQYKSKPQTKYDYIWHFGGDWR